MTDPDLDALLRKPLCEWMQTDQAQLIAYARRLEAERDEARADSLATRGRLLADLDVRAATTAERDQLLRFNKRINQNETDALVRAEDLGADRDRLAAQVESVEAERDAQIADLRSVHELLSEKCAQIATLRAALEPFALRDRQFNAHDMDGDHIGAIFMDAGEFTVAHVLAARAAISQTEPSEPEGGGE